MANLSNTAKPEVDSNVDLSNSSFNGRRGIGAVAVTAAAMALGGLSSESNGQMMWDMSRDPQHQALGQSYLVGGSALQNTGGGVLSLAVYSSDFPNPLRSSLSFLWNDPSGNGSWALGTYHSYANMIGFGELSATASTGSNFNSNPGMVMNVLQVIPYTPHFNDWSQPDLALYHLSAAIPGAQPAVFGTAGAGEMLVMPGFGMYGSQATGIFPRDGNVRAVMAPLDNSVAFGADPAYYQQGYVNSSDSFMHAGRTLSGFSGSPVLSTNGIYLGISTGGVLGGAFSGPSLFQPIVGDRLSWVYQTAVPSPSSAVALGLGGVFAARRRR